MEGWVKCNFDGAWDQRSNMGGYEVVIRNHMVGALPLLLVQLSGLTLRCMLNFLQLRELHSWLTVEGKFQFE